MSGSKIETDIKIKDIGLVKNLIELLEKHYESLPSELQKSLKEVSENGINDFTAQNLKDMYPEYDYQKVTTSIENNIHTINKSLKK